MPVPALDGVNLTVEVGQAIGIIGPNGAGKSTLLKLAAGLAEPTSGRVEVTGTVQSIIELGVGFHPELTGAENVRCIAVMNGLSFDEADAALPRIAEFAGLADALDRPLKHYSLGMKARLAFSLATDRRPSVLAVDEVLAVGDRDFQAACLTRIHHMLSEGTTLLFVSHEMATVAQVCDRVVHLREGRIVDDGPATDVVERYLTGSARRIGRLAESAVTIRTLMIAPSLGLGDPLEFTAEIDVVEPVHDPSVGVDLMLPMVLPGVRVFSSIERVPPLLSVGRYRLTGIGGPVVYAARNLRVEMSMIDRAKHRTLDAATLDVAELGGAPPGTLGPLGMSLIVPIEWSMTPTSSPTDVSTRLSSPSRTGGREPIVRIYQASKYYRARRASGDARGDERRRGKRPSASLVTALDGMSLDVAPGESVGVIGPNSAGKSTLLRVIAGITQLDDGVAEINGRVASMLDLGSGFDGRLTGRENLQVVGRILGMDQRQMSRMVGGIVEFSGLGPAIDVPTREYSTGMLSRLGFAIAIAVPSDVLVIDEALAVGDEEFRRSAVEMVNERHQAGSSVIFVSHELRLVEQVCERVVRMERGRAVDDGPTDVVLGAYTGSTWAGGVQDADGGVRLLALSLARHTVPTGGTLELSGTVLVDEPVHGARLELALRAPPEDRMLNLSIEERAAMSLLIETVVPAGAELTRPGAYAYRCSIRVPQLVGDIDVVVMAVDERERYPLAEAWQHATVGSPVPGADPTVDLGFSWTAELVGPLPAG